MRLLFAIVCVFFLHGFRVSGHAETGSRLEDAEWRSRFHQKAAELRARPPKIIFLGDSITHSFEWNPPDPVWDHWYAGRHAINLGFNGDRVPNVIWRVQHGELDGISPRLAVVLIGTNDLGLSPQMIVNGIVTLVTEMRERVPDTRILVLGILPSGKPAAERRDTLTVNNALAARYGSGDRMVTYQDASCVFLRRGRLNAALFRERAVPGVSEPLHPTPQGMNLLAAHIEPVVAAVLGDRPRSTPGYPGETDCAGHE